MIIRNSLLSSNGAWPSSGSLEDTNAIATKGPANNGPEKSGGCRRVRRTWAEEEDQDFEPDFGGGRPDDGKNKVEEPDHINPSKNDRSNQSSVITPCVFCFSATVIMRGRIYHLPGSPLFKHRGDLLKGYPTIGQGL